MSPLAIDADDINGHQQPEFLGSGMLVNLSGSCWVGEQSIMTIDELAWFPSLTNRRFPASPDWAGQAEDPRIIPHAVHDRNEAAQEL